MNETEHGISIQMRGEESHLYNTPEMLALINAELGDELMAERAELMQSLSSVFKMLDNGWVKWVGLTSDGVSYAEAISCNHATNPNKEFSIHIFHGEPDEPDLQYINTDPDELVKMLTLYLIDRRLHHTRELLNIYPDVVIKIIKMFDSRCKFKHCASQAVHSFVIVPTSISKNRLGIRLTLIPQSDALAVRSRLPLQ